METRMPIVREVPLWDVASHHRIHATCQLAFDPRNPILVTLEFSPETKWVTSRELLVDALDSHNAPVGLGDLRAWTVAHQGASMFRIELRSPEGHALLDLPWRDVQQFLLDTRGSVPMASEHAWFTSISGDEAMASMVDEWASNLRIGRACPRCRAIDCLNADHVALREEIRADRALDRQIEAGEDL